MMDSKINSMVTKENKPKVVSINIVRGCELSAVARATKGISNEDMVEIRVERNSPAEPKITKFERGQSPTRRFMEALKKEGFSGKKILE